MARSSSFPVIRDLSRSSQIPLVASADCFLPTAYCSSRSAFQRFNRARGEENPERNYRYIEDDILEVEDTFSKAVEMGAEPHVSNHAPGRAVRILRYPVEDVEQQERREADAARDDLVLGKSREPHPERQQRATVEHESNGVGQDGLGAGGPVNEQDPDVEKRDEDQHQIEAQRAQKLTEDDLEVRQRGSEQQLHRARPLLLGEKPHGDQGDQQQENHGEHASSIPRIIISFRLT